jgi:hypothetical protein
MLRDPEQRAFWFRPMRYAKMCPKCYFENDVEGKPETVTCEKCGEIFWFDRRRAGKPPKRRRLDKKTKSAEATIKYAGGGMLHPVLRRSLYNVMQAAFKAD